MCGIVAIAFTNSEPEAAVLDRMVLSLSHRGPDARGCLRLPGCYMGHARLSIIDLSTGDQPMADESGRYSITFNGEIYNYRELRRELLGRGHHFRTHSDTEVIMRAFSEWGINCLHRFRGMFAFALWDAQERALFVGRDIFGEKPLYYAPLPDESLALASEIKALKVSRLFNLRLDLGAVDAYLGFGYLPPDRTVYENVETLPPGHFLTWRAGRLQVQRYWRPVLHPSRISLEDAAARLRELLEQAVRRQMVADVPVGAFLSGGLDSGTITAFMQQQSSQPVNTFSVGFGDFINELPYARAVAKLYHTVHHEIDLGAPAVAEMLERMSEVYDEPFADSSHIPTYLIAQFARRYVKVVLSGDGGDELFGGYAWYPPLVLSEKLPVSRFKWLVLRSFSKLLRHSLRSLTLHSWALGMSARWPDMWTRDMMTHMSFRPEARRRLWGRRATAVPSFAPGEHFQPPADTSGPNQGFYFDLSFYLPGDILVKVDRAAMAHGLETRAPFLDRDLAEFLLSLPVSLKINGEQTKILLRKVCADYWPPDLRSRPKQGFGSPYQVWLGFPEVRSLSRRIFAEGAPLRRLLPGLDPRQAGSRSYQTWILLTLGLWLERQQVVV
jgi:asparagine synthase (glutamine-hydrolysing)